MIEHNPIYFGSDIKLKVTLDFGEVSPDSVDWDILLSCGNKKILFNKSLLIRVAATRGNNQTTRATTVNIYGAELTVEYTY